MLTFLSGWRSIHRDEALLKHRDPNRNAIFFIDNVSTLPQLLSHAPIIDVWRNGVLDFQVGDAPETLIRVNYDTDNELLIRSIAHVLLAGTASQLVIAYDANSHLTRLYPALRAANALLVSDGRLNAPSGDRVVFTRGGSFAWRDYVLETQTSQLVDSDTYDAGIVPDVDFEIVER
jgi:hypothetical protein